MSGEYEYEKLKRFGNNSFISANVEIRRPHLVDIGSHVAIDSGFYLTTAAQIRNYVHIAPYVTCIGGAAANFIAEDFSSVAAGARLICLGDAHLGEGLVGPMIPEGFRDAKVGGKIQLSKFAAVGTNAIIMPGLNLAEGSVVGAGALLTKDTEPWTIYVGVPARAVKIRPKKQMLEFAQRLAEQEESTGRT